MVSAAFGTLDLGIITDHLIDKVLVDCIGGVATVTGNAPDIARTSTETCTLSFYLFHASPDPQNRNSPVIGDPRRARELPFQPMSLNLYYLMSACSKDNYSVEQQAMSIAMKCLYETVMVRNVVLRVDPPTKGEYVLTMEILSADDISRLWQSFGIANRLSIVYKVSVVFLEPVADLTVEPAPVEVVNIDVDAVSELPSLLSSVSSIEYAGSTDVPGNRELHNYELSPAVVELGESFELRGTGLLRGIGPTDQLVLTLSNPGTELDISNWISAVPSDITPSLRRLTMLAIPVLDPGAYMLQANVDGATTNMMPISIAAKVTPPGSPPVITFTGLAVPVNGFGFVDGDTEVYLDSTMLADGDSAVIGEFKVESRNLIKFKPPTTLLPGTYRVRIRVNGIESTPALWVEIQVAIP